MITEIELTDGKCFKIFVDYKELRAGDLCLLQYNGNEIGICCYVGWKYKCDEICLHFIVKPKYTRTDGAFIRYDDYLEILLSDFFANNDTSPLRRGGLKDNFDIYFLPIKETFTHYFDRIEEKNVKDNQIKEFKKLCTIS